MINVMIDLETLGTRAGCSVLSIGAAEFGPEGVGADFYSGAIRRSTCLAAGLVEDSATLEWWRSRDGGVLFLAETSGPVAVPLGAALVRFANWLPNDDFCVWGNGADFDLPILAEAYARCGLEVPWKPYSGRCYRTLKYLRPDVKLVRTGSHHNAIDDAVSQAEHAARLMNELGGW